MYLLIIFIFIMVLLIISLIKTKNIGLKTECIMVGSGIVLLIFFKSLLKGFSFLITIATQRGFKEVFSGNLDLSPFIALSGFVFMLFAYISLLFITVSYSSLHRPTLNLSILTNIEVYFKHIFKTKKNIFFLIFTITLSITLIVAGISFLSTAFPNEPLATEGSISNSGSFLICSIGKYSNIIAKRDVQCDFNLSKRFQNKTIKYAELWYFIDRVQFKQNASLSRKINMVTLNFYKDKQHQFLMLKFEDNDEELFVLNHVGIYTKEEYYNREKEKAIWFFTIVSFSIFSIFSAMNNLKQIIGFK